MPARLRLLAGTLLAALVLASCGGDDPPPSAEAPPPASDEAQLEHIHGLDVNPRDGTLYIATHYGLFEAAEGTTEVTRIGDSTQDIMGFSVVSADRFIGSGHPDPSQELPPLLGLIESRDGGQSWENISLLGEADFHVLRSAGERIYGFNSAQGQLLMSGDGGREWDERTPPGGVFDLAVDPRDANRIVASTDAGLFTSADSGSGWRPLDESIAGLLAWPAPSQLFLVDQQGQVARSGDGGRRFEPAGQIGGQPVAFTAHEQDLYAALPDGTVKRSSDGGTTWEVRATP